MLELISMWYNKHMREKEFRKGFTLIEFSLSVAFIGLLSIAVALIINDTIAAYRRGMILNQINTTGIDLVDDFRAAVQNSSVSSVKNLCGVVYGSSSGAKDECEADNARNFTSVEKLATVKIRGKDVDNVPVFGAFCTGSYSYIWNSGYFFTDKLEAEVLGGVDPASLEYNVAGGGVKTFPEDLKKPFRLIKVKDTARAVCISATLGDTISSDGGQRYTVKNTDNATRALASINRNGKASIFSLIKRTEEDAYTFHELTEGDIVEVLVPGAENNLVLYDLRSTAAVQNVAENGLFYSASFVLGTIQGGIDVTASGNYCVPPKDYADAAYANADYCAINKFNFAVQATGE